MSGEFFETWVVAEVYKSYLNAGLRPPVFYYRDTNKREIDLLLYEDGIVYPVEIKKAASPTKATKNFSALAPLKEAPADGEAATVCTGVGAGAVVCMAQDLIPIDRSNWYVPAWII